jgi:PAS domain S-box-containing protein
MADTGASLPHLADDPFRLLVESITDYAIYLIDADGRVATWNAGARRIKGYEAEEIVGEHFSRFFTPEDQAAGLPGHALDAAAREGRFETEGWRVRKDGGRFWAHAIVDPVHGPDGELVGYAKITRDITQKKEAERALYESEQRFRLLVQGVRDYAIYMLDRGGHVTNWNPGAQAIKGYAEDEIVGEHFSRFYTEEDRARGVPAHALKTALREGKYEKQAWRVRKNGERFWASVLIDPIFNEAGEHIGFAKITRDITDQKRAEEELEEARTSLAQSQKLQALGELTGGIAHDFNNLITVIRGSAELLQRTDLNEERRRRYLDAITDTADRAATLTSHLLAFSRRQPLKPEVLDINVRLDALGELLGRTLGSRIEVGLDLAPGLWRVEADPVQLENALLNAAINARDAMPDGGRLTLSTRNMPGKDGDDMVAIAITDTGAGMPPDVMARVFEPFFTTKPIGKGTGLGLSQIHGFAAQTGGRAELESEVGKGTTVRLLLPRSDARPGPASRADSAASLPPGLRVLLVEDNAEVSAFARDLLEDLGCTVFTVASGDEALDQLEETPVDVVFSDVVMPGLSGIDLAQQVRARYPGTPVLLASGYSSEMLAGPARGMPLIGKPYGRDALAKALSKLVTPPEGSAEA